MTFISLNLEPWSYVVFKSLSITRPALILQRTRHAQRLSLPSLVLLRGGDQYDFKVVEVDDGAYENVEVKYLDSETEVDEWRPI
jgi:hypothetical protein